MQVLVHQAMQQRQKDGYHLSNSSLHLQIAASGMHPKDLRVEVQGTLVYQWSEQQQARLARLIASKSKAEATRMLLQQPGVSTISFHLIDRNTGALPNDPEHIHFAFLAGES